MNPKHQAIINEIMNGQRVMPPLKERIRIRDEHLAEMHRNFSQSNDNIPQTVGPEIDYEKRRYSGD
jgi:hypothetical protein